MRARQPSPLVLVIEDEWLIRSDIVEAFSGDGWLVVEAGSGEEALGLLDGRRLDALFTDIQLKGALTGWDVADMLRERWPVLAVIYTSGNADNRTRRVDGSRFFDKPYDSADVVRATNEIVAP